MTIKPPDLPTPREPVPEDEMDLLLPFYATGRLGPEDTARVETALATRADMPRRLALVREEQAETVHLNEALGAPSRRVRDDLFARIDALETRRSPLRAFKGWMESIAAKVGSLSPRTLGWAAAAAALVIVVQAGALVGTALSPSTQYQTASQPGTGTGEGAFLLVGFQPGATVEQIAAFLQSRGATIVDGPHQGGLFRIRVGTKPLAPGAMKDTIAEWSGQASVVRMALPASAR